MKHNPITFLSADEQDEQTAARNLGVAERRERGERAIKSLYRDPREIQLSAEVAAACSRAGIVNQHQIRVAQAKARQEHVPLWRENPGMDVALDRDIREAHTRNIVPTDAQKAQRLGLLRTPIYGTAAKVGAVIKAEQAANRTKPVLNALMHGPAGSAMPVVKRRFADRAEQLSPLPRRNILG